MSFLVAVPAGILLALIGFQSRELHGENLFSGVMAVFVIMAGVLALLLVASPFVLMGLYPKEGFAGLAPEAAPPSPSPATQDDNEDDFEDDDDDMDEEPSSFDDEGDFEDDAGDEEFFDEGMDDDDFDDDDEWT